MNTCVVLHPSLDGVQHINVWSRGVTQLGRNLSNFAHTPFTHPAYGPFESMEAYWYWIATGMQHDSLRGLWGIAAKRVGKVLERVPVENFEALICEGLYYKTIQTPTLCQQMVFSELPFYHYYWFGHLEHDRYKLVVPASGEFQMTYLEDLRIHLKHLLGVLK